MQHAHHYVVERTLRGVVKRARRRVFRQAGYLDVETNQKRPFFTSALTGSGQPACSYHFPVRKESTPVPALKTPAGTRRFRIARRSGHISNNEERKHIIPLVVSLAVIFALLSRYGSMPALRQHYHHHYRPQNAPHRSGSLFRSCTSFSFTPSSARSESARAASLRCTSRRRKEMRSCAAFASPVAFSVDNHKPQVFQRKRRAE